MLWENAGVFFPLDNSLVSARKSQNSAVSGLVVRCLLFNPKCSCSNPCVGAHFLTTVSKQKVFFRNYETPPFRLCETFFENCLMSPKGPAFIFLIFCNRTNIKKSESAPSFRLSALLKISFFFKNFSKFPKCPPSNFFEVLQKKDVKKSQNLRL